MRARGTGGLIHKKGSRHWYAIWWQNGRQYCVSTGTDSKVRAEVKLQEFLGQKAIGKQPAADAAKLRYRDLRNSLLQEYRINGRKSLYRPADGEPYITSLKHVDRFFDGHRVNTITADEVRRFVLRRQAVGASNGTINRALAALKRMFSLAIRDGKLQSAPHIEMLREAAPRKGFLELDDFKRLRTELSERLRAVLTLGFYTGMRLGEIRPLKWENVDLAERIVRLNPGETKNDDPRTIPLNAETLEMLKMLRHKTSSTYVFGNGRSLGSFRKAWISACVRAGLGRVEKLVNGREVYHGLTFHDLRRTGVRNLDRAGVPTRIAMSISGHRTRSTYNRYNIVSERDLKDAVHKLDSYLAEKNSEGLQVGSDEGSTENALLDATPINKSSVSS